MYSYMCFMTTVALLAMDVRTGALQERDIQPSRCYYCQANNTISCEESSSWTTVKCPTKRPLCATTATAPDFHSSLVCAAIMKTPCTVRSLSNSSLILTWVCDSHHCNAPLHPKRRNELINFISNSTETRQLNICESLYKYKNSSQQDIDHKGLVTQVTETSVKIAKSSLEPTTSESVFTTMNVHSVLRDSERPRAESLKEQPTVPSDDDEDESEGSGTYEESKIHNHAVSAPVAPSSFLPANENRANPLYKDLFAFILFIYLVV